MLFDVCGVCVRCVVVVSVFVDVDVVVDVVASCYCSRCCLSLLLVVFGV